MTKKTNAPRPRTNDSRTRIGAGQLRRLIVWTEILGKPVSRSGPRFPR